MERAFLLFAVLPEEGVVLAESAVQLRSSWPVALFVAGVCHDKLGHKQTAVAYFLETLRFAPDHYEASVRVARIMARRTEEFEAAAEHFMKAIELRPRDATIPFELANLLRKQGDLEGALVQFERSLEAQPGNHHTLNNAGVTLRDLGSEERAVEYFERAIASRPSYAMGHHNLGISLAKIGERGRAESAFARAIALDAENVEFKLTLARFLLEEPAARAVRNAEDALLLLDWVKDRAPNRFEAFELAAEAQLLLGESASARAAMNEAIRRAPAASRDRLRGRLDSL